MKKRPILGLLLSVMAMVYLFAGCATENVVDDSESTDQTDVTTDEAVDSEDETEVQIIEIWRPQNTDAIETWWNERIASFNETYAGQYEVVQSTFPKGGAQGYEDKVNTAVLSDSLPDAILVDGPNVASYAANEIIIPIDEYVTEESKADIMPSILAQGTYSDQLYTIGLWDSSVAIFYNKDILAEAGITVPETIEDAWTWDELYEVVSLLNTEDHFGATLHYSSGEQITYLYSPMLIQIGTDLISPDGTTSTGYLNSEETVEFMNYLKKFYDDGIVNSAPTSTEFMDGNSALFLSGPWQIATMNNNYPDLNWGVTYYPKSNDEVIATPCGSWSLGITDNAEDPAATFLFVDYMTNTEANISGCTASGYLPSRYSSMESLPEYNEEPYRVFTEQLVYGATRSVTPVYTVLSPKFSGAIEDVIMGADPQTKLDEAAAIVDDEYQNNYAN